MGGSNVAAYGWVLGRFNPDGSGDQDFGFFQLDSDLVGTKPSSILSVAVQEDGKIVAAGQGVDTGNHNYFALFRVDSNGHGDASFGQHPPLAKTYPNSGWLATDFGGGTVGASALLVEADGKLVAAGPGGGPLAVTRYASDGTLDGKTTVLAGSGVHIATALAVQADGKLVTAGWVQHDGSTDFELVRFEDGPGCDDGDLCTDDRFEDRKRCVHTQRVAFAGASCRLDTIGIVLDGAGPDELTPKLQGDIRKRVRPIRSSLRRAERARGKEALRQLRLASKGLHGLLKSVFRNGGRGKIATRRLHLALKEAVADTIARVDALRKPRYGRAAGW